MDSDSSDDSPPSRKKKVLLRRTLEEEIAGSVEHDDLSDLTMDVDPSEFCVDSDTTMLEISSKESPQQHMKSFSQDADAGGSSHQHQPLELWPDSCMSMSDLNKPPSLPDVHQPPSLPDVHQPPSLPDVHQPPSVPDVHQPPVCEPESIPHTSRQLVNFRESSSPLLHKQNDGALHDAALLAPFSDPMPTSPSSKLLESAPVFFDAAVPCDVDTDGEYNSDYFANYHSDDEVDPVPPDASELDSCFELSDLSEDELPSEENEDMQSDNVKEAPLYPGAPISQWESLTAILSFVQSEHLSGVGLGRLLSLINLHLPASNSFLKSYACLMKVLETFNFPIYIHYFCNICYKIRKGAADICDCETGAEDKCVLFFITFPLLPQLEKMLQRPGFIEDLKYKEQRTKKNLNNIEDIYDGEVYKEAESKFQDSCLNITFMWNTDGMQVFNSNTYSLWPFYFVINELSPSKRFLSENLILGGIWGGVVKPHPNVYLLPIYKEVKSLKEGCHMKCYGDDETCKVAVQVICGVCDAPARAAFMNMKQHSGFYSCPVCITKGEKPGDSTVFPYEEEMTLRNLPQYEENVKWAVEKKVILSKTVRDPEKWCGIKGPTILKDMVPNILTSMGIDSMHCIYLGVMRQMLHLWTDKDLKEREFSIFSQLKKVNERIRNLAPPHFLQRLCQFLEKLIHWKATELRSFLFNLALTILKDILAPNYYNHLALFVKGVALLNSNSISEEDLLLSSLLLNNFVSQFSLLYGVENMSHNLHMLLHLERCVRFLGPLWIISCFKFEDINGRLSNIIHGTRHIGLQIHKNLSIITQLPVMVNSLREGAAKEYCMNILKKRNKLRVTESISPGLNLVGVSRSVSEKYLWVKDLLNRHEIISDSSSVQMYSRLLKQGMLYVAKSYNRGQRVSCYVKYVKDDNVLCGLLQCFVRVTCSCSCSDVCTCETKHFAVIKPKPVSRFEIQGVELSHIFIHRCIDDCEEVNNCDIVNVSNLVTVLFKINDLDLIFLCEPLNDFERE